MVSKEIKKAKFV